MKIGYVAITVGLLLLAPSNAEPQSESRWVLGKSPLMVIGAASDDSSHHLGVIASAYTVPGDSGLVVVDASFATLRVFASDGRPKGSIGRLGEGPGEFRQLSWASTCGQTGVVAYDLAQARFTRLDFAGRVRTIRASPAGFVVLKPLSCLDDGSIVASFDQRLELPERSSVIRATGTLVRIRLDLGRSDTLASFPGNELYFANEAGGYGEVPFGRAGMVAAGRTVAVVAQNDSDWFAIHDLADGMVRRHKLGAAPHMVTRDEFARAVAAKIAEQPRPETRQLLAQVYRDVTVPKGRRFFRQLAVDALDHVWVESFEVWSGNRSLWFVFDRLGRRVGRVAMPQYARPLSITSDRIALHRREDSGAERIEVYSLTR